jgi:DNA-binding MarR family transcriptional regulator
MPNKQSRRDRKVSELIDAYESLMRRLAGVHAPVFAEVDLTMSQAKALYAVFAADRPRMSDLAHALGISLSAASEVVDRLVDLGLVDRAADPADRRHVILTTTPRAALVIERFRELGVAQLRRLLDRVEDRELEVVGRAIDILDRAAGAAVSEPNEAGSPPVDSATTHAPGSHS